MLMYANFKAFIDVVFFFLERKLSFQESLFTAVSNEVKLTSNVQVVVEEIIFQLHRSIFTVWKKIVINSVFVLFQQDSLDVLPI